MTDNKSKRGKPDRSKVALNEPYEIAYFARKHAITPAMARAIVSKHGPSRAKCDAAARRQHF